MNRDFDNLSTLADALLPHLVDRLGGGGGAAGGSSVTLPSVIRWSDIDKSGASLYDIPDRPHGALTYKNVDDHLQYVPQAGRGGFAYIDAITRVRYSADPRYRSDHYSLGSGGTVLNSFDDTGLTYLPLYLDAAYVHLRPGGNSGLAVGATTYWYSGINAINTDNYVSQLAGLHLGYDGSIDCRYLYTEQLHAKAFIADLEQALAGAQIITKSVSLLAQPFTAPYPGSATQLVVKDLPSAPNMAVFESGDTVRVRQFSRAGGGLNITDCWGTVTGYTDGGGADEGKQGWTFTRSGTSTNNTIAQVANYGAANNSGPLVSVVKPTGTVSGHWMVIAIATSATVGITPPSGWTQAGQIGAAGVTLTVFQKLAGGSEPSSYTFTFAASVAYGVAAVTYSNVFTLSYVNGQANAASTAMACPGGIPGSSNDMYIMFAAVAGNIRATPPAGMTKRVDIGATSGIGIYAADKLLSSPSNPGTQTATLASSAASATISILVSPTFSALSTTAGQMYPTTTIDPDAIVLDYGVSGNGYAEVTTVDGIYGANSPYYQIVTWTGHPATGASLKARLGNLSGITDTAFGSFAGKYGLYSDSVYLKGDLETGNGNVRIYQDSGINLQEDPSINWSDLRAIQWWPDIDVRTGTPSLALVAGLTLGENYGLLRASPTNNQLASLTLFATHQGASNDAYMTVTAGSQARGSIATIILGADRVAFFAEMGDGWKSLPYTNGGGTTWTDFGSGWQVGQYKKVGDLVFVRGLGKRTAGSGATIATLPSGYRPASYTQLFVTLTDGGVGRIDVGTGGDMSLVTGTAGWVALNVVFSVV